MPKSDQREKENSMPGSSIEKTIRQGPLALRVLEGPMPDG